MGIPSSFRHALLFGGQSLKTKSPATALGFETHVSLIYTRIGRVKEA
jgi:hypothetical protein